MYGMPSEFAPTGLDPSLFMLGGYLLAGMGAAIIGALVLGLVTLPFFFVLILLAEFALARLSESGLLAVKVAGSKGVSVNLQVGPAINGTSLRDAAGFITFNQFINQNDYADAGSHEEWCMNRYRSYNPDTNTWVSYSGVVHQCVSPFS